MLRFKGMNFKRKEENLLIRQKEYELCWEHKAAYYSQSTDWKSKITFNRLSHVLSEVVV